MDDIALRIAGKDRVLQSAASVSAPDESALGGERRAVEFGNLETLLTVLNSRSGLSLNELGRRTGVDVATLSRFVNEQASVTLTTLDLLSAELGLQAATGQRIRLALAREAVLEAVNALTGDEASRTDLAWVATQNLAERRRSDWLDAAFQPFKDANKKAPLDRLREAITRLEEIENEFFATGGKAYLGYIGHENPSSFKIGPLRVFCSLKCAASAGHKRAQPTDSRENGPMLK